jgi:hypothetical protein
MINFRQYYDMTKCIIPNNVTLTNTDFSFAFQDLYYGLQLQEFSIPDSVICIDGICQNCKQLTTAVCGPNVTGMEAAYINCYNLTTAVCGPNVTDMARAYQNCYNLTTAECGEKVTKMYDTYSNCKNLTTAVCGPNVTDMRYAYQNCTNLTTAVCGPNVTDMEYAYSDCTNLTTAVCGPNVTDMAYAYEGATNIQGNAYVYSPNIHAAVKVFGNRNISNMLNIYIPSNSTTLTHFQSTNSQTSIVASSITWTNSISNDYFYNTYYNIYIYPVENVAAAREANGD